MPRSKSFIAVVGAVTVLLVAPLLPAGATSYALTPCTDRADKAQRLTIRVAKKPATGHFALPRKTPRDLVVFAHGYGHTSYSWIDHMRRAAKRHGVLAVGMDYRGLTISEDANDDGLPESRGWNALAGAQDLIAAARYWDRKCSGIRRITIVGVSMGGNMSGLAVAMSKGIKRTDGKPLFDYWFDVEGAVNVIETYMSARAISPSGNRAAQNAVADIEAEMGGPIEENHEAYLERAVVNRVADIKAAGLKGAVVIHGLDDGLVPYNQGREMTTLLTEAQIPVHMFTIGRRSATSERETTVTGYVGGQLDPDYTSPLAGHASEKSTTHIVMVTAFERLWELIHHDKAPTSYREFAVDGEAGTLPEPE